MMMKLKRLTMNTDLKKMMDMMGGGMPDQEKMAALFKEQDDKLKKVLTEDQHKKWTDHMQQMMQNFGGGF